MSVISDYKKSDPDTQTSIMAVVFFVSIVIVVIIGVLLSNAGVFNTDLSFSEEKEKCQNVVNGTALYNGIEGYCDTYIGSDGDMHYKYVQVVDVSKKQTKDIYIIWETNKVGKY